MAVHTIEMTCPECRRVLRIANTNAGQSSKCPHCGATCAVPGAAQGEGPSEASGAQYWFYAKEYGFGWGLPACWQGWAVFVGYIVLALAGIPLADAAVGPVRFVVYISVLSLILIAICWFKGEPLAWRWGERTVDTRAAYRDGSRGLNPRAYLVFHVFLGPLILVVGLWLYLHPPAQMNHTYGYRTDASFQGQDAWDEAQRFSAEVMIAAALVTIACQGIAIFALKPPLALIVSLVIMLLGVIAVVPITEAHLNNHFDGHNRRIAQQSGQR